MESDVGILPGKEKRLATFKAQFKATPVALMKSSPTPSGFGVGNSNPLVYDSYYKEASSSYRSLLKSAVILQRNKQVFSSFKQ